MTPRIRAISGPLRSAEFELYGEVSIGHAEDNVIRLDDPAVSPHHCRISLIDDRPVVMDLDSRSGTFLNGLPVRKRELKPGDEMVIGESLFRFEIGGSHCEPGNPAEWVQGQPHHATLLERPSGDLYTLDRERLAALPLPDRAARNLNALIYICKGIQALRDEESLPWQLLSMTLDLIPADRGVILLTDEGAAEIRSQVAWDRMHGPDQPVHVGRDIVQRVLQDGVPMLDTAATASQRGKPRETDEPESQRTFLCVPLMGKEKPRGLVYLESDTAVTALTEDDSRLLAAVASLGAISLENARQLSRLGHENQRLRAEVSIIHDMVGSSARMGEVYQFIERVAPTDSTVLIYGESGTGKELVANAIHKNSARKSQPFVALNCAALTETLLESELFGHEKGAFTSAISQKKGFLEVAEGGTIFLDEIGELSPVLQAKLLRVLQEREFVRVGGTRPIKINVRFLAATNRDLQKWVREEKFRADLFHRLNVISITLPALREHREDIPPLAEYFSARHARNCSRRVSGISSEAMACLTQYDWPGNVRELENALERAVVIGSSETIQPEDLPEAVGESAQTGASTPANYHDAIRNLKKQIILGALEQANGSITEAAKLLGVHANYLHRLMRNLELRPLLKKQAGE